MTEILNKDVEETIMHLGALIRKDPRTAALSEAEDKYNSDPEMTRLVMEYNVQQSALAAQYQTEERDEELIRSIEGRINEIYDAVTKNELYEAYIRAKADYDELYNEVQSKLEFAITGRSPCTHDCSTCGGCH